MNFTVVINPGSGPGPNALPDGNYTREIPKLASYENVRLLGYVATTYAKRNISLVRRDIETYAAWPTNSSNPALAVRGIFFDETPQQYDEDALAYLQELTDVVKNTPGLGPDHYVRFPGNSLSYLVIFISIFIYFFYLFGFVSSLATFPVYISLCFFFFFFFSQAVVYSLQVLKCSLITGGSQSRRDP